MSATEYTVIFKPGSNWTVENAAFALRMWNSTNSYTVNFKETNISGVYNATYNSDYDSGIMLLRVDPSKVKEDGAGDIYGWEDGDNGYWGQSNDLDIPASDVCYDYTNHTSNYKLDKITPTSLHSNWILAANRHIAANYDDWSGTSANNAMASTDGVIYTLTVSNRPIKAGWYGFKFVGDNWYGNPDDSGNNYYIEIANDDYYDITYTFNRITKRGSAVATAKNQSPTIEYKYYVYDNDAASWDGITAFTGENWTACEMTNVDGTYVYAISGKALTSGTRYGSRFVEKVTATGSADQSNFLWIGDGAGGAQGCRYYDCTSDGTYNIVFTYKPSDVNYDLGSAQPKLSVTQGLYALNSGDDWSTGVAMTFEDGVYKATLTNIYNKYFALAPTTSLSGDAWNDAIRPQYDNTDGAKYSVNFINYSGTGVTGGKCTWYGEVENINVALSYRPSDGHWEVAPYFTGSISTAGYATYSHGSAYKITGDGVGVYTITATAAGEANMSATDWNDAALPAGTGVVLTGSTSSATPYTVTPSDGSASIGTNLLVGSGDDEITLTASDDYTNYILANKTNGVKFYKWDESTADNHNKLADHKAYLRVPTGAGAPQFFNFNFGGETTGISKIDNGQLTIDNSMVFNLAGQRVMNPTKGLYIVNGKKVVLK